MTPSDPGIEVAAVAERYARRTVHDPRYSLLRPEVRHEAFGRQSAWLGWLDSSALLHEAGGIDRLRLVEVGCGDGSNLLEWLRVGCAPERLTGLELLPDGVAEARRRLPVALQVIEGDASVAPLPAGSQDLVIASTVFSSLLDDVFQQRLADAMWSWLRPGGAVLWYDFTWDNPRNPDVRGVPRRRVQALFPQGQTRWRRVTLAPPLARAVGRVQPGLVGLFNLLPPLRTHLAGWIEKPR
ncbi:MAG: class I SAM-dependent methyltransferase [Burkholderiaceae bacterium]|nr:class I SAM-dependent methyltransferase [Burkholderiaceae bacterium]